MTLAEDILDGLDIVDVVGRYVSLTRSGANYKGLCPFHGEKSPSFVVSPQKQIFKCFGCGEGGDAITFIKKIEHVEFIDAAKILAKDAGVDMEKFENVKFDKKVEEWKDKLKRMNTIAMKYFVNQLQKNEKALDYVQNRRRQSPAIIQKFQLGYAPDSYYAILEFLRKKGFSAEELQKGSMAKRSSGSTDQYAFFRHRIMFPIRDHMGNVIGFGGRALDADQKPKFVNTTDTVIYDKSRVLYGINFAKEGVKKHDWIAIVEGYMDVIAMARLGYDNAVATCGTSLTDGHMSLLKRYTESVYFLFDQDKAGFLATKRGLKMAYKHDIYPAILILPTGKYKDLDDVVNAMEREKSQKETKKEKSSLGSSDVVEASDTTDMVENMVATKVDGMVFVLERLKDSYDLTSPIDKKRLLNEIMEMIVFVTNIAIQDHYLQVVADSLSMNKQVLEAQLKQYIRKEGRILRREMNSSRTKNNFKKYTMSGEMLLASLLWGNKDLDWGEHSERMVVLTSFIEKLGMYMEDSLLAKMITGSLDNTQQAEMEQLFLWWESEFERFDTVDAKISFVVKTIHPELKRLLQQVMKYASIDQKEKMNLLKEMKIALGL